MLIAFCVLLVLVSVDATCIGKDPLRGPGGVCDFPFMFSGWWYFQCMSPIKSAPLGCPLELDEFRLPVIDRWGNCSCDETHCSPFDVTQVHLNYLAGEISTASVGNNNASRNGTCRWKLGNPLYTQIQHVPISLFIMTRNELVSPDFIEPGIVTVYDNSNLLFSTKKNPNVFGTWTKSIDFHVQFDTPGEYTLKRPAFGATVYTGFCSNGNGEMVLPEFDVGMTPHIPLITNDHDRESRMKYRKLASCQWDIKISNPPRWQTLIFEQFDLGAGDQVRVELFTGHSDTPDEVYRYNNTNPAQVLYTDKRMRVHFTSDAFDEKQGFAADIVRDSCKRNLGAFSTPHGVISDGTRPEDKYNPGLDCSWEVKFGGQKIAIAISFNYFHIRPSDVFAIYDSGSSSLVPIKELSGNQLPNSSLIFGPYEGLKLTFKSSAQDWSKEPKNKVYGFQFEWKACVGQCNYCFQENKAYDFNTKQCVPCPDDSVLLPNDGFPTCMSCPKGHMKRENNCIACPIGSYSDGGKECSPCPEATIAPTPGTSECIPCDLNFTATNNTCVACPEGEVRHKGHNDCSKVHIPMRTDVILLYCGLGLGAMILIGALIAFLQWRQNQEQNQGYQPLSMMS